MLTFFLNAMLIYCYYFQIFELCHTVGGIGKL